MFTIEYRVPRFYSPSIPGPFPAPPLQSRPVSTPNPSLQKKKPFPVPHGRQCFVSDSLRWEDLEATTEAVYSQPTTPPATPCLIKLATSIRSGILNAHTSSAKVIARVAGSWNFVHILQLDDHQLVIRVPATGWGDGLSPDATQALESQAATLRLLQRETIFRSRRSSPSIPPAPTTSAPRTSA